MWKAFTSLQIPPWLLWSPLNTSTPDPWYSAASSYQLTILLCDCYFFVFAFKSPIFQCLSGKKKAAILFLASVKKIKTISKKKKARNNFKVLRTAAFLQVGGESGLLVLLVNAACEKETSAEREGGIWKYPRSWRMGAVGDFLIF